ncbi:MAG: recE [Gordonia sp. (in: high G+C Gram-positive bacteria)]|nr:MAG: recE [Gordonia sp. (in: high G+C Gram-positive bacteria)]
MTATISEPPSDPGIYEGLSDIAYHADRNSLSSSGARTLLEPGGPAKFRYGAVEVKKEWDFGHVAHALVLGEGSHVAVIDAKDWRTKAAKEAAEDARAAGQVPILTAVYDRAKEIADAALSHPLGEILFSRGVAERSWYWDDPVTGVRLRCRPDWDTSPFFVDYKTTKSADPAQFIKSAKDYGYHCQEPFYTDGAAALGVETEFLFFCQEKTAPYLCSVVRLPAEAVAEGRRLNRAAIDLYARCVETDTWPGYEPIVHTPPWPDWYSRTTETTLSNLERLAA